MAGKDVLKISLAFRQVGVRSVRPTGRNDMRLPNIINQAKIFKNVFPAVSMITFLQKSSNQHAKLILIYRLN